MKCRRNAPCDDREISLMRNYKTALSTNMSRVSRKYLENPLLRGNICGIGIHEFI